jgi:hypothetical protein
MLDLGGRLTEERKYVLALLAVPKHRSKKTPLKPVQRKLRKCEPKVATNVPQVQIQW